MLERFSASEVIGSILKSQMKEIFIKTFINIDYRKTFHLITYCKICFSRKQHSDKSTR